MDQFPPNSMTSTHTGNPVCAAAALASIELILKEKLVENAAKIGEQFLAGLDKVREKFPKNIAAVQGKGMVAGVHMVKPGTDMEPDAEAAFNIIERCMEKGLLMFAPVGVGGGTVKIAPPLITTKEAMAEGLAVFEEAVGEVLGGKK
jgi:4-aminobutyrate aminotransferase / (S)-3-amino-2-methylpropionate transaminase / 5-aminovalerate transaminase